MRKPGSFSFYSFSRDVSVTNRKLAGVRSPPALPELQKNARSERSERWRRAAHPGLARGRAWSGGPLAALCGHREGEAGRGLQRSGSEGQRRAMCQSQSGPQLCGLRKAP